MRKLFGFETPDSLRAGQVGQNGAGVAEAAGLAVPPVVAQEIEAWLVEAEEEGQRIVTTAMGEALEILSRARQCLEETVSLAAGLRRRAQDQAEEIARAAASEAGQVRGKALADIEVLRSQAEAEVDAAQRETRSQATALEVKMAQLRAMLGEVRAGASELADELAFTNAYELVRGGAAPAQAGGGPEGEAPSGSGQPDSAGSGNEGQGRPR